MHPTSLPWRGGGAAQPWRKCVALYPTLISGILAEGVCHPGSQKSADPAARHFKRLPILAPSRKWIVHRAARDFGADEVLETEGILCVFQGFQNAQMRQKIRRTGGKTFWRRRPIKKGAGRTLHSPRCSSRFAFLARLFRLCFHPRICASGGQNLAALCTAAGQNLTAVGSSHSLTETVNLGTVTLAGLVGTLHTHYTSRQNSICSTAIFGRSNT